MEEKVETAAVVPDPEDGGALPANAGAASEAAPAPGLACTAASKAVQAATAAARLVALLTGLRVKGRDN